MLEGGVEGGLDMSLGVLLGGEKTCATRRGREDFKSRPSF